MTATQAATKMRLAQIEQDHPAALMTFALMRADPEYQPSGDLLDVLTEGGLAEGGKMKPEIRDLL